MSFNPFFRLLFATLWAILLCARMPDSLAEEMVTEKAADELVQQMESVGEPHEELPEPSFEKPEIVDEQKKTKDPELPKGPSFTLSKIVFDGNTVFPEKDLQAYSTEYLNKTIVFEDLRGLTMAVTNHYRTQGYLTSRAYIPPQKILNQTLTVKIIEGKIGEVIVKENKYFRASSYKNIILKPKRRVFRYQDLERSLYQLNARPDRRGKAYLIPGLEPDTVDVLLQANEKFPLHFKYLFHNHGTKSTHRARHVLQMIHNSLTGFGDQFQASLTIAEEGAMIGGAFGYEFPLDKTNTVLSINSSIADSRLVKGLKPFEIEGESFSITPKIRQLLFQSKKISSHLNFGLALTDSETTLREDKLFFERLRVLFVGNDIVLQDRSGHTNLNVEYRYGIPNFIGSLDRVDSLASRNNAGGEFTSYLLQISRIQKLPKSAVLILKSEMQWSWDTLASLERFRAGGSSSVRGYPESDATGDYGYQYSAEFRIPPYGIPRSWMIPKTSYSLLGSIRLLAFIEGAKVYSHQRQSPSDVKDKLLLSSGFGVRFNAGPYASFQLDWGFPFGDKSSDDKDSGQIHLSSSVGF